LKTALLALLLGAGAVSAAPVYYLFDGDGRNGYKVDLNANSVNGFDIFDLGYPVAIVDNKIRLHSRKDEFGHEYDLNGVATGVTFPGANTAGIDQLLDGTTNGVWNFAVQCCSDSGTNKIWRASTTWQNFEQVGELAGPGSGIAFDPVTNSLFALTFNSPTLYQYSLSGTLLNAYNLVGPNAALAYDAASDTLFGYQNGTSTIYQFTKTGAILDSWEFAQLDGSNIWGGEITSFDSAAVPEPGFAGLTGAAFAAIIWSRRRRA
jgi:hypothetical protein